jgi:ferrochelatase
VLVRQVILVNLGTPSAPQAQAVRSFLADLLSDPRLVDYPRWLWLPILRTLILRTRPPRVAELYRAIWGPDGSPLDVGTRKLAAGLSATLGGGCRVAHAYRHGQPSVHATLAAAATTDGAIVVVPLFPQRTGSTTGTIDDAVRGAARELALTTRLTLAPVAPDDAGYVEALAERWRTATTPDGVDHLVVSFHAIPTRVDRREKGLYRLHCEATFEALLEHLGWSRGDATICYQSRFGPEPWLQPTTSRVLRELPARGASRVAVFTPGFLTEGLETLEEIGVRGRATFLAAGGTAFVRVPAVEDHPAFVGSLAAGVRAAT